MSKYQKLAQINKIANECAQDGDFELASKFHNEFLKISQVQKTEDNTMITLKLNIIIVLWEFYECHRIVLMSYV